MVKKTLNWLFKPEHAVDVVLMDIQMSIVDGKTAVMCLLETGKFDTLSVIKLTGGALLSEREKSLQA
ncbi:hypothetical protein LIMNO130_60092 [Limnobacter sp. 130]|uniref:hypothetical protein n=1 Tax=Limnobacter sp. 130 TaxID=2653147 RepID=UPI0012F2BE37|nr:hypothetical protein [Limnobacter sp. 130]VWX37087.1 hypothetical protein LIMNO130_60092 [Limnobacter sp. 130]